MTPLVGEEAVPFVGESLRQVKQAVGNESTVLGFVGAPFTLASYIVEGGSSKNYTHIKKLAFQSPEILHALLGKLADNIADYVRYQVKYPVFTVNREGVVLRLKWQEQSLIVRSVT